MLLNLYSILLTLVTVIVRHVEPGRIEEKNMFRHKKKKKAIYINKQQIEHFQMSPLAVFHGPAWLCFASVVIASWQDVNFLICFIVLHKVAVTNSNLCCV